MNYIFLVVGIVGLVITGIMAITGRRTLSQRAQVLFPRWADWIVGIVGAGIFCDLHLRYLHLNPYLFTYWVLFWGHTWIANKERYKED